MGDCRRRRTRVSESPWLARSAYNCGACVGFADALLCHAGHIAVAIEAKALVTIPEQFMSGDVQATPVGSACEWPTENSVCLEDALDVSALLTKIQELGGIANVADEADAAELTPACSFLDVLPKANPVTVMNVTRAMQPSEWVQKLVGALMPAVEASVPELPAGAPRQGVCVYHQGGPGSASALTTVDRRTSHLRGRWVFHVGDGAAAAELRSGGIPAVTRAQASGLADGGGDGPPPCRLGAVLDYFVCSNLPHFVGDSDSTWSGVQIAKRHSLASWYNSRDIKLTRSLNAYDVPIVYTHTDESPRIGMLTLQASILATLRWTPASCVHVLYHGNKDKKFRSWLQGKRITIHNHEPTWGAAVEQLRLAGLNNSTSFERHRFVDAGTYFGTWQRLDVPLYVSVEYCLLLDSDAFLTKRLTFSDLGQHLPAYLAISSEFDDNVMTPLDSGVTLMNIPSMRSTLKDFHAYVFSRADPLFQQAGGIAHHGAYREFYGSRLTWLDLKFSMKPVWRKVENWKGSHVIHFHGLKPSDIFRFLFKGTCAPVKCYLMIRFARNVPYLCWSIQIWARESARTQASILKDICKESVADRADLCINFFKGLVARKGRSETCRGYAKRAIRLANMTEDSFPWLQFWD